MNSARLHPAALLLLGLLHPLAAAAQCLPCERPVVAGFVSDTSGQAEQFQVRRAGAIVDASWRFDISTDGWYRVTQAQLLSAGLAASRLVGSELRLFNHTQEVALAVSTDALFGPGDSFHFFGLRYDGEYTRTNAYWLGFGGTGKRLATTEGAPLVGAPLLTTACYRVRYDPNLLYRPFHQPLDAGIDHWFAALVNSSSDATFSLNTTNRISGDARLHVQLYGLSTAGHQARLQVNGSTVGSPSFSGPVYFATNVALAASLLTDGSSTIGLRDLVGSALYYLIDAVLDYPGRINATGAEYYFCGEAGTNVYSVSGLATNLVPWLLDVTRPAEPVRVLQGEITTNGARCTLRFTYAAAVRPRFLILQPDGVRTAPAPREVAFRNLADTARQADYLLICPPELRRQSYRLAKHHHTNGLQVVVAPLPDIYNEFGYGVVEALALKQFIGYAFHHWALPRPRFGVLIGKGADDPLGFTGSVPPLQVPVHFGPTPFVVAAQDVWYGLVDGNDLLADVAVGRIAVSTDAQFSNVVNKILSFTGAPIVSNALLVADNDGVIDFAGSSNTHLDNQLAAGGFSRIKVYLPYSGAQATIQATINSGRRLVTYVGHGAVDRWSAQNIWNTSDVLNLGNTVYPLVAIFSCNNGGFVDRSVTGLAEAFIEAPRGASSTFAPTALAAQAYSDYVAAGFARALAVDRRRYLGDVALEAQLNLYQWNPNVAELLIYQIIGDPGLIVNSP